MDNMKDFGTINLISKPFTCTSWVASGDLICSHWHHPALLLISSHHCWLAYRHPQVYFLSRLSAAFMDGPGPWWHTHTQTHPCAPTSSAYRCIPLLLSTPSSLMNLEGVELQMLCGAQVSTGTTVMKALVPGEAWVRSQWVCMYVCEREKENSYCSRLAVFLGVVHV